ncbi:MAG: SurA N-terminal domain-containing protein [Eubacteriaceae bacterium]
MKRIIITILISFMIFSIIGCSQESNVVAQVNDQEIFVEELDKQMILTEISYSVNGYTFPEEGEDYDYIKEEMLNNLVESYILIDLAKNIGIEIDEDTIQSEADSLIESIIEIYDGEDSYEEFLEKRGQKRTEFEEYIFQLSEKNHYIYSLYNEVTEEITINDEETKEFYEKNIDYYNYSTISIMSIITETQEKADEIYSDIDNNDIKFEDAIKTYTDDENVLNASDFGAIYYGDMPQDFSEIAFDMKIGEMSTPFISQDYYYIVYLYDKDEQEPLEYGEIEDTIKSDLLIEKGTEKYNEYFDEEKSKYDIKIYSDKL